MTSEEIKNRKTISGDYQTVSWLQEIAYQLALMNEKKPELPIFEQIFGR